MTIEINALERKFKYNQISLSDPNPAFTIEQVRDFYANVYPEIINAEIEGPTVEGNTHRYNYRRAVGTKGSDTFDVDMGRWTNKRIDDLLHLVAINWLDENDAALIKKADMARRPESDVFITSDELQRIKSLHSRHCLQS
jgi:PRTRC genetic system protein C